MKSLRLTTGALCAAILLSACSSGGGGNTIAGQAKNGGGNYVAGDGAVEQLVPAKRGKPIAVSGALLTGSPWSTADAKGKVVILNVWGSWCPPCQREFPDLQKAWTQLKASGKPVVLMGVDYNESADTALATMKSRGLTYPSLRDDDGQVMSALGRNVLATPTTLVLDSQHRLAARVSGPVNDSTLVGLVDDALSAK